MLLYKKTTTLVKSGRFRFMYYGLILFCPGWESEGSAFRCRRVVDVALAWLKGVELSSPARSVVGGAFSPGAEFVATDGKSCEDIGHVHVRVEREGNPVDAIHNGYGMFGKIDRHAFQGEFTLSRDFNLVQLCHIQGGELSSPTGAVI